MRRWLIPTEHGAWAQLLFPLATALVSASPRPSVYGLSLAAACGFLATEGVQVLSGRRGPRAARELAASARLSAGVFGGVGVLSGAAAISTTTSTVHAAIAVALFLSVAAILVAWHVGLKTTAGELFVVVALASWAIPVALAGGTAVGSAVGRAALWVATFGSATLAVRGVVAGSVQRADLPYRAGALSLCLATSGVLGFLTAAERAPTAMLAGFLPAACLVAAVAVSPPSARHLRQLGWGLVAVSIALFVSLLFARDQPRSHDGPRTVMTP